MRPRLAATPATLVLAPALVLVLAVSAACGGPTGTDPATSQPEAASPSATASVDSTLRVSTDGWATDFSRHDVPLGEIISGGPGKDGIPAIDEPIFEPVEAVGWLEDAEPVIALGTGGAWRAYPIQILVWHEIVNDTLGETPVSVTFCPLCHTGIVFDRRLGDRTLDFGTTGNLRHSDLVMYDRQTESWWQQATGRGIVGELTGNQLEFLPSQLVGWARFRDAHPEGEVLSRDTGHPRPYGQNPYPGYDRVDSTPILLDDTTLLDGRLSPKVRVLGVQLAGEAVAYPFPTLLEERVVNDEIAATPVVVIWATGTASGLGADTVAGGTDVGAANAFLRDLDDRTLTFEPADDGLMRDTDTASTWSFEGHATDGALTGSRLQPLVADSPFWFAWAVFRPDTHVWEP